MIPADTTPREQEQLLVRAAQRGDADALRRLVELYDRRLVYFLLRLLPDADRVLDVMQEVWLTVLRRLSALRAPEAFRVWLYQIAHGQAVSEVRRQRRDHDARAKLGNGRLPPEEEGPEVACERADLIHQALALLTPEHREVLLLRFLEDMSLDEIALTLTLSVGTVKSRLHYARQALRGHVEKLSHA